VRCTRCRLLRLRIGRPALRDRSSHREIRFGDGVSGRIPPVGTGNLRLARYQTGGGSNGNRAAGTVAQLKTTAYPTSRRPPIRKAARRRSRGGKTPMRCSSACRERFATATVRSRWRTTRISPPGLHLRWRALCECRCATSSPIRWVSPAAGSRELLSSCRARATSKPLPTMELLEGVGAFLAARRRDAQVSPWWDRCTFASTSVPTCGGKCGTEQARVEARRLREARSVLHPLTGGLDGSGWDFGRAPHRSDFLR